MPEYIVTGVSPVVEADDQFAAVDRAQDTSGWHWEAKEVDHEAQDPSEPVAALNWAIFAINTMLEPDASSDRDVEQLLEYGEAAVETLAQLRGSAERLKGVLP